jgi:hypothetical protein
MGCGEAQPLVSGEQAEVQLVISQDNTSVVNKACHRFVRTLQS